VLFSQTAPVRVQIEGLHVHVAAPPLVAHVSCGPHVVVGTHAVQPSACVWHVSTPVVPHWVAPAVHALVQHDAAPASPVQPPPVHGVVADSKMQPCVSCEHVASVEALAHVGPAARTHTGSWLHPQLALPAAPAHAWCALQATGVPYA
jgi:hypothetical protein